MLMADMPSSLIADGRCNVDLERALLGVAGAICSMHKAGRKIRSLGFIAAKLYGDSMYEETAWAYAIEPMIDPTAYDRAADLVAYLTDWLESRGFPIEREVL